MKIKGIILGSTAMLAGVAFGAKANVAHADAVNTNANQAVSQSTNSSNVSSAPAVAAPVQSNGSVVNSGTTNVGSISTRNNTVAHNVSSANTTKVPIVNRPVTQQQTVTASNVQRTHPIRLDDVNTTMKPTGETGTNGRPQVAGPINVNKDINWPINANLQNNNGTVTLPFVNDSTNKIVNITFAPNSDKTGFVASTNGKNISWQKNTNPVGLLDKRYQGTYNNFGSYDYTYGSDNVQNEVYFAMKKDGLGVGVNTIKSPKNTSPDVEFILGMIDNTKKYSRSELGLNDNVIYYGFNNNKNHYEPDCGVEVFQNGNNVILDWSSRYPEQDLYYNDKTNTLGIGATTSGDSTITMENAKIVENNDGSITITGVPNKADPYMENEIYDTNAKPVTITLVNNLLAQPSNTNNSSSNSTNNSSSSTPVANNGSANNQPNNGNDNKLPIPNKVNSALGGFVPHAVAERPAPTANQLPANSKVTENKTIKKLPAVYLINGQTNSILSPTDGETIQLPTPITIEQHGIKDTQGLSQEQQDKLEAQIDNSDANAERQAIVNALKQYFSVPAHCPQGMVLDTSKGEQGIKFVTLSSGNVVHNITKGVNGRDWMNGYYVYFKPANSKVTINTNASAINGVSNANNTTGSDTVKVDTINTNKVNTGKTNTGKVSSDTVNTSTAKSGNVGSEEANNTVSFKAGSSEMVKAPMQGGTISSNESASVNNNVVLTGGKVMNDKAQAGNAGNNHGLPDTGSNGALITLAVIAGLVGSSATGIELIKKRS